MEAVSRRQRPGMDPAEAFHVPTNRGNPAEISPISSSLPSGSSTLVAAAIPEVDRFVLDLNRGVLLTDGLERAVRAKTFAPLRAQEGGSRLSVPGGFYHASQATTLAPGMVQSGSSDVDTPNPYNATTYPQFDFSGAGGAA
jgi:hypothetical protein